MTDARAVIIRTLLGDDVMAAMDVLRDALWRYSYAPRSKKRQAALIAALETVMAVQVNRIQSTTGVVLTGPVHDIAQLRFDEDETRMHVGELEEHEPDMATRADLLDLEERVEALEEPPDSAGRAS